MTARRVANAFLWSYCARLVGFTLTAILFGWDAEPPSFAITFQCFFTLIPVLTIAIIASLARLVLERALHLPAIVQAFFLSGAYFLLAIFYGGAMYSSSDFTWRPVVTATALADIIVPAITFHLVLHGAVCRRPHAVLVRKDGL